MVSVSPSSHNGMGSIIWPGRTVFRVWAPHADSVSVAGTFNNWSRGANPQATEGNGYCSADVSGATARDQYRYLIASRSKELLRNSAIKLSQDSSLHCVISIEACPI